MRVFETWQMDQLNRIGAKAPARLEEFLLAIWNRYPALYEELAINAVDEGALTQEEAAERLGLTVAEVQERLTHLHHTGDHRLDIVNGVARLVSCGISVWEVVREFRANPDLEHLSASFPSIPMSELRAALRYAQAHPEEIEAQIEEFENLYAKRYVG
jgi:uncharacterized protein (DUF433 family)